MTNVNIHLREGDTIECIELEYTPNGSIYYRLEFSATGGKATVYLSPQELEALKHAVSNPESYS